MEELVKFLGEGWTEDGASGSFVTRVAQHQSGLSFEITYRAIAEMNPAIKQAMKKAVVEGRTGRCSIELYLHDDNSVTATIVPGPV